MCLYGSTGLHSADCSFAFKVVLQFNVICSCTLLGLVCRKCVVIVRSVHPLFGVSVLEKPRRPCRRWHESYLVVMGALPVVEE